jgi:hypothetical protein
MNTHPSIVPSPADQGKPVRDLLEDIHRNSGISRIPRGIVNPKLIDHVAFAATVTSVVVCTATLLGMVWEGIDPTLGIRVMASVLIVLFALLIFRSLNRAFSE